jgi:predicted RNA-binding Zn-ribbon protein involved in translation (DUF1610 family)
MGKRNSNNFQMSSFYCPKCGKKAMDLPRPRSLVRQAFHRKKLYCPWCKETYNCIECRDEWERRIFIEDWEAGLYANEAIAVVE